MKQTDESKIAQISAIVFPKELITNKQGVTFCGHLDEPLKFRDLRLSGKRVKDIYLSLSATDSDWVLLGCHGVANSMELRPPHQTVQIFGFRKHVNVREAFCNCSYDLFMLHNEKNTMNTYSRQEEQYTKIKSRTETTLNQDKQVISQTNLKCTQEKIW